MGKNATRALVFVALLSSASCGAEDRSIENDRQQAVEKERAALKVKVASLESELELANKRIQENYDSWQTTHDRVKAIERALGAVLHEESTRTASISSAPPQPTNQRGGGFTDFGATVRSAPSLPPYKQSITTDRSIIDLCNTKWGTNFEMVESCQKGQQNAKDTLAKGNTHGIPGPAFDTIRGGCSSKWGSNFEMREYCEKEQAKSYRNVNP